MSYILDALRKADAQRERDPARGIHAQPGRDSMGDSPRGAGLRAGIWAAGAVGVAALAAGGWYLYRDPVPPPASRVHIAAAPVVQPQPTAPPPAAPSVPRPVVPATVVLPPPEVVSPPVAAAPPSAERSVGSMPSMPGVPGVGATARAMAAQAAQTAPMQQPAATPPAAAPSASPPGIAPAPPGVAPAPGMAVPPLATGTPPGMAPPPPYVPPIVVPPAPPTAPVAGLPADAPKLVITGGVYSASKAQRMLIVNGQVMGEGADLGSGVTLEEIKPKSAVLRFRGGRYSVSY